MILANLSFAAEPEAFSVCGTQFIGESTIEMSPRSCSGSVSQLKYLHLGSL